MSLSVSEAVGEQPPTQYPHTRHQSQRLLCSLPSNKQILSCLRLSRYPYPVASFSLFNTIILRSFSALCRPAKPWTAITRAQRSQESCVLCSVYEWKWNSVSVSSTACMWECVLVCAGPQIVSLNCGMLIQASLFALIKATLMKRILLDYPPAETSFRVVSGAVLLIMVCHYCVF